MHHASDSRVKPIANPTRHLRHLPSERRSLMFFQRWSGRNNRKPIATPRPRFVPRVELLEARELLSRTFTVINTNDAGEGSLRWAITSANADPVRDQIYFNIAGGVQTIALQSALPKITAPVTIDGYGQGDSLTPKNHATPNTLGPGQGTNANLSVQLTGVSAVTTGLDVTASRTVIRGRSIVGAAGAGTVIEDAATGVQVVGDFIGTQANGSQPGRKNGVGLQIDPGSTGNLIGSTANADRILISGNGSQGIRLLGGYGAPGN